LAEGARRLVQSERTRECVPWGRWGPGCGTGEPPTSFLRLGHASCRRNPPPAHLAQQRGRQM